MKVVVTDAYSPTNIGDGELVRLSIESVRSRFAVEPTVLCTDRDGFESTVAFAGSKFVYKPLSRVLWRRNNTFSRGLFLIRDAFAIAISLLVAYLPAGRNAKAFLVIRIAKLIRVHWLVELVEADVVVGVGGGYLGDKYLRESLITLAIYRIAHSTGSNVETMPVSISSATNTALRFALQHLGRGVAWRSRENTTHSILSALGLDTRCVPDLAWLNSTGRRSVPKEFSLALAPLGSDFYHLGSAAEPKVWAHIKDYLDGLKSGDRVALVAMHYWDPLLQDGRDDDECKRVKQRILEHNPGIDVEILALRSYQEVLATMASAEMAVCERLHAALASLAVGTPTKVVGYEPKHRGVLELAGLDVLVDESLQFVHGSVTSDLIIERGAVQAQQTREAVMGV